MTAQKYTAIAKKFWPAEAQDFSFALDDSGSYHIAAKSRQHAALLTLILDVIQSSASVTELVVDMRSCYVIGTFKPSIMGGAK